jgi:4-diphosphocytidyl-2-C-methyl-D-erythritol kinase
MVAFPPCKINLGLRVLRRRADGYHDIDTCFYQVPRTDILEVVPAPKFSIQFSGSDIPGAAEDNLCVKAYELLRQDFQLSPVSIHLHKLIPTGAGLGGGSSDGTWTLRMLNEVCGLGISAQDLSRYALALGSDCPFFLNDKPQIGGGRGDSLASAKISLRGKYIVLVKPDIHVSTKAAYEGVTPRETGPAVREIVEQVRPEEWKDVLVNQFERSVIELFPVIGFLKSELYNEGALYASMSGSGSAVYGIFDKEVNLRDRFGMHNYWSDWLSV